METIRRKKTYRCKICNREYQGFRKSNTCSFDCGMESFFRYLDKMKNPSEEMKTRWRKMSLDYRKQFKNKKGNWYEAWANYIKKMAKKL